MKKLFIFLTLLLFIMCLPLKINAKVTTNSDFDIKINEQYILFSDLPFIWNSIAYAPVRGFTEAVTGEIYWQEETKSAKIQKNGKEIVLYPHKNSAYADGMEIKLEMFIKDGRIFVPVRFISETFGWEVSWDDYMRNVNIVSDAAVDESKINQQMSDEDVFWMGRVIEAESGGEPYEGKVAVGNVVLNRVKSEDFPNTIYEVIFDRKYGVQFQPVLNGSIYNTPSGESIFAAKASMKGDRPVGESLYFLNPQKATSFWIINNRTYHSTIKNHDFYI